MRQKLFIFLGICGLLGAGAFAQTSFSSGSTGADGAFAPTQSATVQVPPSGTFNYTTVTIPSGVTITYVPNAANTPLTILATGDITISGSMVVDGQPGNNAGFGGLGGPGGFAGGAAVAAQGVNGNVGNGPGGGGGSRFVNDSTAGDCSGGGGGGYQSAGGGIAVSGQIPAVPGGGSYGSPLLIQLLGGSGGGGGSTRMGINYGYAVTGGGGGGGGGAVLVASSTQIVFPASGTAGLISANGAAGAAGSTNPVSGGSNYPCAGGGGAGGAIHLVSNKVTGIAQFNASGGAGGVVFNGTQSGAAGGSGYVRVDAFNLSGFSPTSSTLSVSSGLPNLRTPSTLPSLQVASVAGVSAPSVPAGTFQNPPDIVLPSNQANPVTVVINAANIPVGTTVALTAVSAAGTRATATGTLSGTSASSTTSISISLFAGPTVLTASTTTLLSDNRPMFFNGEPVDKVEVATRFGGQSELTYITRSGRRVSVAR